MATTYYVDGAVGNDVNAGTSEGAGNAWATIDHAMNTVVAADDVWVKASATYTETATLDTGGSGSNPIAFRGYTSVTGDGGRAVIDGQSTRASGLVSALGQVYYRFENFQITDHTSHGGSFGGGDYIMFINCLFDNNGGVGIQGDNYCKFVNCDFDSNTSYGADVDQYASFIFCTFRDNSNYGALLSSGPAIIGCLIYGNTNGQLFTSTGTTLINCTMDGENAGIGLNISGGLAVVANSIIYDHTTGLIASYGAFVNDERYNLFNSNGTDRTKFDTGPGVQTGAPAFTDEGAADYTLQDGSPAKDTGKDLGSGDVSIGAYNVTHAGGGGGVPGSMSGGLQ